MLAVHLPDQEDVGVIPRRTVPKVSRLSLTIMTGRYGRCTATGLGSRVPTTGPDVWQTADMGKSPWDENRLVCTWTTLYARRWMVTVMLT